MMTCVKRTLPIFRVPPFFCPLSSFCVFSLHFQGSAFLSLTPLFTVSEAQASARVSEKKLCFISFISHFSCRKKRGGNNRYLSVSSTQVALLLPYAIHSCLSVFTHTLFSFSYSFLWQSRKRHSWASKLLLLRCQHASLPSSLLHSYSTYIVAHSTVLRWDLDFIPKVLGTTSCTVCKARSLTERERKSTTQQHWLRQAFGLIKAHTTLIFLLGGE